MRSATLFLVVAVLASATPLAAQHGSPAGPIPVELLQQRRARLLDRIGNGVVVLQSARVLDRAGEDYPQTSDFRQDNDFFYLTGLETPSSRLVLVAHTDRADEVFLYVPPRDEALEQWTGPQLGTAEAATQSGIANVRTSEVADREIAALLAEPAELYVKTPQKDGERALGPHLAALRMIKDEDELRRLRRAVEITSEAHNAAMQRAAPGVWEYQLEATIEFVFHDRGAERVGFPSIVGSGPNSTALHYDESRRQTRAGDLIVIDIGAEFGYYTADITRTIPVSGQFTPRQRALYDLVLGAQRAAIAAVKPGATLLQLDVVAREHMQRNSAGLCGGVSCDRHFVHGLSHWLGMDVHDPGDISTPLAAGMVLTVEPGIYLPGESLGIRIEDDVLVTADGHEVLSRAAPVTAADIEQAMASKR